MLALIFVVALGTTTLQIPLKGDPPPPAAMAALNAATGVERVKVTGAALALDVAADGEVRLGDLSRALGRVTTRTTIDAGRLAIGPHTIFEINAGQCFFCAEAPLASTLSRMKFVRKWTVVDYATKGRLRFRVEPVGEVLLSALGGDAFEDILFTGRYDETERVNLYWPTGGVAWRPNEQAARREATISRKPLMIFPTAGT
jgi:hypothetical protein